MGSDGGGGGTSSIAGAATFATGRWRALGFRRFDLRGSAVFLARAVWVANNIRRQTL